MINHPLILGALQSAHQLYLQYRLQVADCCVRLMECSRDLSVSLFMDMSQVEYLYSLVHIQAALFSSFLYLIFKLRNILISNTLQNRVSSFVLEVVGRQVLQYFSLTYTFLKMGVIGNGFYLLYLFLKCFSDSRQENSSGLLLIL